MDRDDIVLVGFSREAFTARSTASLIASTGLLNTEGMAFRLLLFIFEDGRNMAGGNRSQEDLVDDSYRYLTKHSGVTGKAKILWENQRKDDYQECVGGG